MHGENVALTGFGGWELINREMDGSRGIIWCRVHLLFGELVQDDVGLTKFWNPDDVPDLADCVTSNADKVIECCCAGSLRKVARCDDNVVSEKWLGRK